MTDILSPITGAPLPAGDAIPSGGSIGDPPQSTIAPADAAFVLSAPDARLPNAITLPGEVFRGTTPPADTYRMWLDTSATPGLLKYYDSTTDVWTRTQGIAYPIPVYALLTADFTAGAIGATGELADVQDRQRFPSGTVVLIWDSVQQYYGWVTSWSTDPDHGNGIVMTRLGGGVVPAPTGYGYTVANGSTCIISGWPGPSGGSTGSGYWGDLIFDGNPVKFNGNNVIVWHDV